VISSSRSRKSSAFSSLGSSVCVMQWRGVIKDKTLTQKDIASIYAP